MTHALLIHADTDRSMDLFHAIPASIVDPFLYAELDGRRVALISRIDEATVRQAAPDVELVDPFDLGRKALLEGGMDYTEVDVELAARACERLGIRSASVNWDFPVAIADRLRAAGVEVAVDHRVFQARRRVKPPHQLDGIRRAQAAAQAAMAEGARLVRECRPGLTAEGVRAAMQAVCEDHGATLGDDVIVAVNGQAALGHDSGSGPVAPGDCVLIDIWPRDKASRCWADMTRTFVAGGAAPPEELARYWALCREALDAAVRAVRPGVNGREVYGIAADVFERAGQPTQRTMRDGDGMPDSGFFHGLGHGVGLEVHEAPSLGLAGDDLVAGDVIAIEPGCYRPGFGGVRLEDLVLVTADGHEVLTDFPYELAPPA